MIGLELKSTALQILRDAFRNRLNEGAPLAIYTTARLGGPAEALMKVDSAEELIEVVTMCWRSGLTFVIIGSGSNVLIGDTGLRGLAVINRTCRVQFDERADPPKVWAESGVNLSSLSRQAAERGLAGLEWAVGIPGTVGGAVICNAGAHGRDIASILCLAEILHLPGVEQNKAPLREEWPVEKLEYSYRSSILKGKHNQAVVLAALFHLEQSTPQSIRAKMNEYSAHRRRTQPRGANMGSIFKNPPGDYAGRLIEAAGLKGTQIGKAQISPIHANFFLNLGQASSADMYALIQLTQQTVAEKFGVNLELEIELLGEW